MSLPTPREVLESLDEILTDETWITGDEVIAYGEGSQEQTKMCLVGGARIAVAELLYTEDYIQNVLRNRRKTNSHRAFVLLKNDMWAALGLYSGTNSYRNAGWGTPLQKLMSQVVTFLHQAITNIDQAWIDENEGVSKVIALHSPVLEKNPKKLRLAVMINQITGYNDAHEEEDFDKIKDVIHTAIKLSIKQEEKGGT